MRLEFQLRMCDDVDLMTYDKGEVANQPTTAGCLDNSWYVINTPNHESSMRVMTF